MSTICLSENAEIRLKKKLKKMGYQLIEIRRTAAVYDAVSAHGDIYLCSLKTPAAAENPTGVTPVQLVVAPEQLPLIRSELEKNRISYHSGARSLSDQYPGNICYNAAQLGRYLVHNTKYTDPAILNKAKELGLEMLHVNQGYTKCSLVIVDDHAVITSDQGIMKALSDKADIDTLLIAPGHVSLEGFPHGFLGGASGRIDGQVIFNGDLSAHPDFERIMEFISRRGLDISYFPEYPLEDIGSIIQL